MMKLGRLRCGNLAILDHIVRTKSKKENKEEREGRPGKNKVGEGREYFVSKPWS